MCGDPDTLWYPQRAVCHVEAETAAANALYDQLHQELPYHDGTFKNWSKERTRGFPYHARDGVTIFVSDSDLNPDDAFLQRPEFAALATPEPAEEVTPSGYEA